MVLEVATSALMGYINVFISANLYLGAFAAMFVETVFPPVPSEVVLPLLGYFVSMNALGYAGFAAVLAAATAGAVLGATVIYAVSRVLGRTVLLKYGRYMLISDGSVAAAERWFARHGSKAIFFGRMAPGVRELVSVPAGLSKMGLGRFLAYTTAGSLLWNAFLASLGFFLGEAFESLPLSQAADYLAVIILAFIGICIALKLRKKAAKTCGKL